MAISALSTIPSIHLQPQIILQLASWAAVASFNVNVGFTLEGLSVYPTVRDKTCFTHIHTQEEELEVLAGRVVSVLCFSVKSKALRPRHREAVMTRYEDHCLIRYWEACVLKVKSTGHHLNPGTKNDE